MTAGRDVAGTSPYCKGMLTNAEFASRNSFNVTRGPREAALIAEGMLEEADPQAPLEQWAQEVEER